MEDLLWDPGVLCLFADALPLVAIVLNLVFGPFFEDIFAVDCLDLYVDAFFLGVGSLDFMRETVSLLPGTIVSLAD